VYGQPPPAAPPPAAPPPAGGGWKPGDPPLQPPTYGNNFGPGVTSHGGTPDNWSDYYPNEGEGRGDAFLRVKFGPGGRLNEDVLGPLPQGSARDRFAGDPAGFANWQHQNSVFGGQDPHAWLPGEIHDTGSSTPNWPDAAIARQQKLNQGYVDAGGTRAGWSKGGPIKGTPLPNPRPSGPLTYTPGGPIPPAAGGRGAPGAAAPTGTTASTKKLGLAPVGAENQGAINAAFKGKPNGTTVTVNGRKLLKNPNGAIVDVTDPKNRQRLTNRQGQYAQATPQAQAAQTQAPAGNIQPGMQNLSYRMSPEEMAAQRRQEDANAYRYGSAMPGGGQGQWVNGPQGMTWQAGGGMSPQQNYRNDEMMGGFPGGRAPMYQPGGMAQFLSGMGQGFNPYGY
jgi:hypothetical protein